MALHKNFVTLLALHMTPQLCLRLGRPMFAAADFEPSILKFKGDLPSGLDTLRSGPACANIFLIRVYQKSLCDIFLPPHKE